MLKRTTYLFIYLFICLFGNAQINLVPNYSFEDKFGANCQPQMGMLQPSQTGWVKNWYSSSSFGTPDYFHVCANFFSGNPYPVVSSVPTNCLGYQTPHTGDAYAGSGLYGVSNPSDSTNIFSEPFSVKLRNPLKSNQCYYGEMYVSLSNASDIAINQIGMLLTQITFTTASFSYTNTIQPQIQWDTTRCFIDTVNWVKISGTFVAKGGEQYLTIGNFRDGKHLKKTFTNGWTYPTNCSVPTNSNVCYIYVDDVALYELPTPQLQSNAITICPNADTLVLGDTARMQTRYQWFANGTAIDTTSFIKVKPTQTTTYVLQSTNCTTNTQTIVVTYSNNCEPIIVVEPLIPNVFTPNNDSINDVWRFSLGKGNTLKDMSIFNRWGNIISQKPNNLSQTTVLWDGRTTSGDETPSGVYFYVLQYTDPNGDEHKKNGYITLIK